MVMESNKKERIRTAVRYFYDLQRLRIQSGGRSRSQGTELDVENLFFIEGMSGAIEKLEKIALKQVSTLLKGEPIYELYLTDVKGIGPTMAGVILAEVDITRCNTISALWRYAGCGVNTETNKAERSVKGEKNHFNAFFKMKMLGVLGDSFIKSKSPMTKFYYDYKNRMQAKGWGNNDAHRHRAAIRYMIKMFLMELWIKWREIEGLPVTPSYAEKVLGLKHGDHGVSTAETTPPAASN